MSSLACLKSQFTRTRVDTREGTSLALAPLLTLVLQRSLCAVGLGRNVPRSPGGVGVGVWAFSWTRGSGPGEHKHSL